MKKTTLITALCVFFMVVGIAAHGQSFDVAFALNGVTAPSASSATGNYSRQSVGGGIYPSFSGDFLFYKKNMGVDAELAWRGSRALYQGFQPYRPLFWDVNGIWAPRLAKAVTAEVMAGIGAESIRFYGFQSCNSFSCTNYVSSNHFMGHFGGGLRLYVKGGFFVRPEAHLYLVRNNVEFSSAHAARYGVSIGYSFGER